MLQLEIEVTSTDIWEFEDGIFGCGLGLVWVGFVRFLWCLVFWCFFSFLVGVAFVWFFLKNFVGFLGVGDWCHGFFVCFQCFGFFFLGACARLL